MDFILFFSTAGTPEENLDAAAAADPIVLLDQEQINRLENVLRSEEAKDILGDVLSNAGNWFIWFIIYILTTRPSENLSLMYSEKATEIWSNLPQGYHVDK